MTADSWVGIGRVTEEKGATSEIAQLGLGVGTSYVSSCNFPLLFLCLVVRHAGMLGTRLFVEARGCMNG